MRSISLRRAALGSASFIGLSMALANPAFAQDSVTADAAQPNCDPNDATDPDCQPGPSEQEIESGTQAQEGTITVTGSRIRRPNLESQVPVTSIGGEEFFQQGQTNVGETLNELPALRSTFAQQNPGLGIGIAGLNLLDLRGLGTVRTLVLVNGRRHVAADILNNAVSPDVNTIPNDLIERVDVVTGGNSAIYGSDAIAGVVNFILRRDYEGIQVRGNAGITGQGFGGNQYASVLAGMNFNDGRGNITGHVEYANQERIFASDIPSFRRADGFVAIDADTGGLVGNSDGFPDAAFFRDIRSASINFRGLVSVAQTPGQAACGTGIGPTNGAPGITAASLPYNCTFIFNDAGRLVPQTGTRTGAGVIGGIIGGNGQTGREGELLSILPSLERFNANILARYEFSEAFELFLEAKATRIDIRGSNFGPSFVQGVFGTFDFRERTRLDNPFLNPADRTTLANAILASNCNSTLNVVCPATTNIGTAAAPILIPGNLTPAQRAQVADGSYRFTISRLLADVSNRDEEFRRQTFRGVVGLRGTFNTDWSYELSANYGITEERTRAFGFLDRQRAALAFDVGRNPANGQIQCRSQFDPAARVPLGAGTYSQTPTQIANNQAKLAADVAACVPYNAFGLADNRASVEYFTTNYQNQGSLDQLIFSGFVSGDTSDLFELPGGPVRFAIGAEYRREELQFRQDPLVFAIKTNAVEIPDILPDPFEVKEAFAEIQIPLLRDTPFFEELTISGAGRVAEYQGGTGTVYSYNGGVEWSPIRDLRFRANYGRAVRAPNVSETASPLVANFSPGFTDPCSANNINTNANRAANCAADLGPLLATIPNTGFSLGIISGSNPNLEAEESDSYTIGGVFQPRFLPGFSLTVDYFDITLNGQIAGIGAQGIVNACYDQPTLQNPFCAAFQRNRTGAVGPGGEAPGAILNNTLINAPLNFASRKRRGVDFELAYRTDLGSDSRLNTRLIYTHVFQNSNFESATNPNFENIILSELGDPQDEFRWNVDVTLGQFTLGYIMRYIGPQVNGVFENYYPANGVDPTRDAAVGNLDAFDIIEFPSVVYHNLRAEFRLGGDEENREELSFFFGVDNLTDQDPPLGSTATGAGSAIYSIRGRNFYSGFRARF